MDYQTFNKNGQNTVSLGLVDLFAYSTQTKHAINHVKINYNLETNSCLVDANISNKVELTEISSSLMSQVDYLFNSLIDSYKMVFYRNFLTKIFVEADMDIHGILYDSIKVSCFLKTNISEIHISSWKIICNALNSLVNSERADIVERPATSISLNCQRKRIRSILITTDYSLVDDEEAQQSFQKSFSQAFMSTLQVLVNNYQNFVGSHQPSANLCFSLVNRDNLVLNEGHIYPTKKLKPVKNQFAPQEVKYIILQIDQILNLIAGSRITGLLLKRRQDSFFITNFKIVGASESTASETTSIDVNFLTSNGLANALTTIATTFSLDKFYKTWVNEISVELSVSGDSWNIDFEKYHLSHTFKKQNKHNIEAAQTLFQDVADTIHGYATIKGFCLTTKSNCVSEISLDITYPQDTERFHSTVKPMEVSQVFSDIDNTKIYHSFKLTKDGYYLDNERYLGWAQL